MPSTLFRSQYFLSPCHAVRCVLYCLMHCSLHCPAISCHVLSCPVLPCPALPCPALSCPVLSCPALPCPAHLDGGRGLQQPDPAGPLDEAGRQEAAQQSGQYHEDSVVVGVAVTAGRREDDLAMAEIWSVKSDRKNDQQMVKVIKPNYIMVNTLNTEIQIH